MWAAKEKHPLAMYLMGIFFLGYYKINPNFEKAVFWFKRAIKYKANKDFGGVEYYLGHCYENGFGIPQNTEKAIELYTTAANKKFPQAMKKLSVCYAKGINGCPVDKNLSNMWNKMYEEEEEYTWDMTKDLSDAGYKLDMFAAEEQLIDVIEDAREVGSVEAEYCLGLFYDSGFGGIIEHDETQALQNFKSAASKGHAGALYCLAKYYEDGKGGLKKQPDMAMKYYKEAALGGDHMAKEVINRYKHMPLDDKTRAMIKEARRQRLEEEAKAELARKNSSASNKFKATVQKVINKTPKKDKGKAPEGNTTNNVNTNNVKKQPGYSLSTLSPKIKNTLLYYKNQSSKNSNNQTKSTNNNSVRRNNRRTPSSKMVKLPTLIEESYSAEDDNTNEKPVNEIAKVHFTEYQTALTETNIEPINVPHAESEKDINIVEENDLNEEEKVINVEEKHLNEEEENLNEDKEILNEEENNDNLIKEEEEEELSEEEEEELIEEEEEELNEEEEELIEEEEEELNEEEEELIEEEEEELIEEEEEELNEEEEELIEEEKEELNKEVKELGEKEKREIIANNVQKFTKKYNKIDDDHIEEFKNTSKEINILENEIIGSDNSDSVQNINTDPEQKVEILEDVEMTDSPFGDQILDKQTKSKNRKNFNFLKKVKGFNKKNFNNNNAEEIIEENIDDNLDNDNDNDKDVNNIVEDIDDENKPVKKMTKFKKSFKYLPHKASKVDNDIKDDMENNMEKSNDNKVSKGLKILGEKTKGSFRSLSRKTKKLGSRNTISDNNVEEVEIVDEDIDIVNDNVEDATYTTNNKFKYFGEKTKEGFKSLGRRTKTKNLGNSEKEDIQDISDQIKTTEVEKDIEDDTEETNDSKGKKFRNFSEKTKSSLKQFGRKTKDLGSDIKDGMKHTTDKLGEKTKDGFRSLSRKTKGITRNRKDGIKHVPNKTNEVSSEIVEDKHEEVEPIEPIEPIDHEPEELINDMEDKNDEALKTLDEKEVKDIEQIPDKINEKHHEIIVKENDKLSLFEYEEEEEDRSILEAIDEASRNLEEELRPMHMNENYMITESVTGPMTDEIIEEIDDDNVEPLKNKNKNKNAIKSFGHGFKKFLIKSL